jgi:hypothetical protein
MHIYIYIYIYTYIYIHVHIYLNIHVQLFKKKKEKKRIENINNGDVYLPVLMSSLINQYTVYFLQNFYTQLSHL